MLTRSHGLCHYNILLTIILWIHLMLSIESEEYDLQCPDSSQWALRASSYCQYRSNYACLFSKIDKVYKDECINKPEPIPKGFKIVWQPKTNNGNCKSNRFQPFNFWTNESSDCAFQKSKCSEEGQILVEKGTGAGDASCRCDIDRGYIYLFEPANACACIPSEADCSCYLSRCLLESKGSQCINDPVKNRLSQCSSVLTTTEELEDKDFIVGSYIIDEQLINKRNKAAAITITVATITIMLVGIILILIEPKCVHFFRENDEGDELSKEDITSEEETSVKCFVEGNAADIEAGTSLNVSVEVESTKNEFGVVCEPESSHDNNCTDVNITDENDKGKGETSAVSKNECDILEDPQPELQFPELEHSPKGRQQEIDLSIDKEQNNFSLEHEDSIENQYCQNEVKADEVISVSKTVGPYTKTNVIEIHGSNVRPVNLTGISNLEPHSLNTAEMTLDIPQETLAVDLTEFEARHENYLAALENRHVNFYKCKTFDTARELVENNSCVSIIGASGDGKTALAEHIALNLKEVGFALRKVHTPQELNRYLSVKAQQVFIVDDPFGKQKLDGTALSSWVRYSKILKDAIFTEQTKIISTIRKPLYQENEKRIKETMLTQAVLDLSLEENQLSVDEKVEMMIKLVPGVKSSGDLAKDILEQGYFPGFPIWCHVVGSRMRQNKQLPVKLCKPQIVLKEFIREMKQMKSYYYCSLVLSVLNDGTFDVNELSACDREWETEQKREITRDEKKIFDVMRSCNVNYKEYNISGKMKDAFCNLNEVYLNKNGSCFSVLHDSITDAVAEIYGDTNLKIIFNHSSSKFLREYVRTKDAANDDELNVYIKITNLKYYELLAQRFIQDIKNGAIVDVFLNPSITDDEFQFYLRNELQRLDFNDIRSLMFTLPPASNTDLGDIGQYTKFVLDIAISSSTAFHWVCRLGLLELFSSILMKIKHKKKFLEQLPGSTTPLHFAAGYGHFEIAKELIEIGVDVNVKSFLTVKDSATIGEFYSGFTPLLYAARQNHPKVTELLLQNKADPDLVRDHGGSPMLLAADRGHTEVVEILLKYNGNPNIHCDHGTTPLILAAQEGHLETLKVLIKNGAKLDMQKFESNISAVYGAAKKGHLECVKILVDKGANINLKGENDLTPLQVAIKNNHTETAKYLNIAEKAETGT